MAPPAASEQQHLSPLREVRERGRVDLDLEANLKAHRPPGGAWHDVRVLLRKSCARGAIEDTHYKGIAAKASLSTFETW